MYADKTKGDRETDGETEKKSENESVVEKLSKPAS